MELKSSSSYLQPSSTLSSSTRRNSFHGVGAATATAGGGRRGGGGGNVFGPTFSDPLCGMNVKEASEIVRSSFPVATMARSSSSNGHGRHHEASTTTSSSSSSTASAQRRRGEPQQQQQAVPATPGRPLQFFASPAHHHQLVAPRRSVPSKWEDAEKWLRQSSDSDSHHGCGNGHGKVAFSRQRSSGLGQRGGGGEEEERRAAVAVRRSVDALQDAHALALYAPPAEVLLKDKFTDNEEPSKESFVFRSSYSEPAPAKGSAVATDDDDSHQRRDIGTEMTPLGSSCHTPLKSTSPARHNTPASRSGPLVPYTGGGGGMDISELADCHLAKLDLGARFDAMLVNWSSKEEEEEEVSKSLRHFEATVGAGAGGGPPCEKRGGDCRWEDDDRAKSCIRYQREEAKIQAWINLESAKAEAQSRKLEVKIHKMRSNLEEKLMRRMTTVHRRAEEWRATAQAQHLQQLRRVAADNTRRLRATSHHRHLPGSDASSCSCFPCSNNVISGTLLNYY
ncbi:hypothetical protein BS78_K287600 [Paspalum vaginatum]|uniref:Remorin C-terminal domain-containing protein n=1 Tax=Paspalum vaginatum TaxID=158149 RepID=A0A9W8CFG3_9POAL|nr:hypothetical protein BS78_K287600 [Paspalum vaginatum]